MAKVLITAGGTGGHIYPGMAVADILQSKGHQLFWLGSEIGMERKLVADRFKFYAIDAYQLRGKGLMAMLALPWRLLRAVWQAWRVLRRIKPDAVIAFGGFVSGPGGIAAWLLGIPLTIHEQNARVGLTNRWLARIANTILEGFPCSFPQEVTPLAIGNPVRQSILEIAEPEQRLAQHTGPLRILVLGGSLGALAINTAITTWLADYKRRDEITIKHQTGQAHIDGVREAYRQQHCRGEVVAYIDDMCAALTWADVIICRAGALTVTEIAAVGLAAIFIPLPHAADNHQYYNADYLVRRGAGIMLEQKNLSSASLTRHIDAFLDDRQQVLRMSQLARADYEESHKFREFFSEMNFTRSTASRI